MLGEKLAGRFVLVRTKRRQGGKEQWLLIKKNDAAAVKGWDPEDHPKSVKSGRTNDEVLADPEYLWHGDRPAGEAEEKVPKKSAATTNKTNRSRPRRSRHEEGDHRRRRRARKPASWRKPTASALKKLDDLGASGTWVAGGEEVKLTNLDKVLFPADPALDRPAVTKRDLVRYYATIAPVLLPYLADRPVNVHRFPDGSTKQGFWQKAVPNHAPDWVTQWQYPDARKGETERYAVIDEPSTLVWEANQAAVELHPWTSAAERHDRPTWALVDIDPGPSSGFDDVVLLAGLHRTALDHLGVVGLPKVTGKRGIQIWIPIAPKYTFDETRAVGRTALTGDRRHRSRPGQLEVAPGRSQRVGPTGLHAERRQQDAGRPVQPPTRARCARVGPAAVGGARRPGPPARRVDGPHGARSPRPRARPVRPVAHRRTGSADALTATPRLPHSHLAARLSGPRARAGSGCATRGINFAPEGGGRHDDGRAVGFRRRRERRRRANRAERPRSVRRCPGGCRGSSARSS